MTARFEQEDLGTQTAALWLLVVMMVQVASAKTEHCDGTAWSTAPR